jgi:hypothetical protein
MHGHDWFATPFPAGLVARSNFHIIHLEYKQLIGFNIRFGSSIIAVMGNPKNPYDGRVLAVVLETGPFFHLSLVEASWAKIVNHAGTDRQKLARLQQPGTQRGWADRSAPAFDGR